MAMSQEQGLRGQCRESRVREEGGQEAGGQADWEGLLGQFGASQDSGSHQHLGGMVSRLLEVRDVPDDAWRGSQLRRV